MKRAKATYKSGDLPESCLATNSGGLWLNQVLFYVMQPAFATRPFSVRSLNLIIARWVQKEVELEN